MTNVKAHQSISSLDCETHRPDCYTRSTTFTTCTHTGRLPTFGKVFLERGNKRTGDHVHVQCNDAVYIMHSACIVIRRTTGHESLSQ